jgi:hypothetical protein
MFMKKIIALAVLGVLALAMPAFAQQTVAQGVSPGMTTLKLGQHQGQWESTAPTTRDRGSGQYWFKINSLDEAVKEDGTKYFRVGCEIEVYGSGVSRSRQAVADQCTEATLVGNVLTLKTPLRSATLIVGNDGEMNGDGYGTTAIKIKNLKKVH